MKTTITSTDELVDLLVNEISDVCNHDVLGMDSDQVLTQTYRKVVGFPTTPRAQLREMLMNAITFEEAGWNGANAASALIDLLNGASLRDVCSRWSVPVQAVFALPIMANVFPRLFANEVCSIQPLIGNELRGQIFFLDMFNVQSEAGDASGFFQLKLCSKYVTTKEQGLHGSWAADDLCSLSDDASANFQALMEIISGISHEIALESNWQLLDTLYRATLDPASQMPKLSGDISQMAQLYNTVFSQVHGDITHLMFAPEAWKTWSKMGPARNDRPTPEANRYIGLEQMDGPCEIPNVKLYRSWLLAGSGPDAVLGIRRGQHLADVSSVWAPYRLIYKLADGTLPNGMRDTFQMQASTNIVREGQLASMKLVASD